MPGYGRGPHVSWSPTPLSAQAADLCISDKRRGLLVQGTRCGGDLGETVNRNVNFPLSSMIPFLI